MPAYRITPEATLQSIRQNGVVLAVTLPILETVKTSGGHGYSVRVGVIGRTVYNPPEYSTGFRQIRTLVRFVNDEITIEHAQPDGRHEFISKSQIEKAGKTENSVIIELYDGARYVFSIDDTVRNAMLKQGFVPETIIDIIYKIVSNYYEKKNAELLMQFVEESAKFNDMKQKYEQRKGFNKRF